MSMASRRIVGIVWTALALLTGAGEVFAQSLPTGFAIQPVIAGIFDPGRPVGFAELPDGRFLIVERNTGQVRLHPVGGATAPVVYTVGISTEVERGLLGVAVDPEWPARPYVYLYYTYFGQVCRLTMYTCTGDLVNPLSTNLVLTSPYQLLTDIPDLSDSTTGERFVRTGWNALSSETTATPAIRRTWPFFRARSCGWMSPARGRIGTSPEGGHHPDRQSVPGARGQ